MNSRIPPQNNYSTEDITRLGEEFYLNQLKSKLENSNNGDYVVIDVQSKKYFIDRDLMIALNQARKKFPDRLFFIVQIGTLQASTMNYKKDNYGLLF